MSSDQAIGNFVLVGSLLFIIPIICMTLLSRHSEIADQYMRRLLHDLEIALLTDFALGHSSEWRWRVYRSVQQRDVLKSWWRSPDSFFPDKSFLDPHIHR